MKYKLTQETLMGACYFINDWLRLMGFGAEYRKLVCLVKLIALDNPDFDFSKYYYIKNVLK
jgi:hypothetical protein